MLTSLADDTIAAAASPTGESMEGIVRLSGSLSLECVIKRFIPLSRRQFDLSLQSALPWTSEGRFEVWPDARPAPCTLYYWPPGCGFTGQEGVELHLPGCRPLLEHVLSRLRASGEVRLAEPGEFTLRAFLSGRIDLTQAEAVLGVIDAVDGRALDTALAQLAGGIASPLRAMRESLLEMVAHLEAGIDFAEEGITFVSPEALTDFLFRMREQLDRLRERLTSRHLGDRPPSVVLFGLPNAGKSSLYNALCNTLRGALRDRPGVSAPSLSAPSLSAPSSPAIISATPGTTRDYLESELDLNGVRILLIDTAGMGRYFPASPDQTAVDRTWSLAEQADLRLLCVDAERQALEPWETRLLEETGTLLIRTKSDLRPVHAATPEKPPHRNEMWVSTLTGEGLESLSIQIRAALLETFRTTDIVPATAVRCTDSLEYAGESLHAAWMLLHTEGTGNRPVPHDESRYDESRYDESRYDGSQYDESLLAAELRRALDALGEVVGAVYTEDILDRVFSRFCIGK